jgi:hypothetical protein
MTDKQNSVDNDDEFPLEAYIAVYNWIGNWAESTRNMGQRRIAKAAYDALTAVGLLMRDVMRKMAD